MPRSRASMKATSARTPERPATVLTPVGALFGARVARRGPSALPRRSALLPPVRTCSGSETRSPRADKETVFSGLAAVVGPDENVFYSARTEGVGDGLRRDARGDGRSERRSARGSSSRTSSRRPASWRRRHGDDELDWVARAKRWQALPRRPRVGLHHLARRVRRARRHARPRPPSSPRSPPASACSATPSPSG